MSEYKEIKGFEGLYAINIQGNVKSIERIVNCGSNGVRKIPEKIKKIGAVNGYPSVNLFKESKCYPHHIHRLIAIHFIPNPDNLPIINHKNGIKTDNRIENLEWCTYSDNITHAYENGLREKISPLKGRFNEHHPKSKKIAQFNLDGTFMREWGSSKEVNRQLGFNNHNIRNCANGRIKTAYGFAWKFI